MFYYVIYNSTVLNYSENNKNLNTFIYGTVLYILLHGLINSYNNQFALYIKSYFWVILAIDIFSIYYMYNYLNAELDNDKNSLKALIDSFYKKDSDNNNNNTKKNNDKNENTKNQKKQSHITKNKQQNNIDQEDENENEDENNELEQDPIPASNNEQYLYQNINDNDNNDNNDSNNTDDQMSDAGSDIDLDKFEMTL